MKILRKILIANRGEIAVRIIRSLIFLGIEPVVIFSQEDKDAYFVSIAKEKYLLEGNTLSDTYLDIDKIIRIALRSGSQAIHPGYGFLSENPAFARACQENGIVFIGPSAEVIELMGDKLRAVDYVASLGLPVIPRKFEHEITEKDFPLMVKAVAGGGGKAMRLVRSASKLPTAIEEVGREAMAYFADNRLYLERYLENVRHIEVQILADGRGNAIHLFERECTIQRRNQKIIEEAPADRLSQQIREELLHMGVKIAASVNYSGAGTIEFLLHNNKDIYFLEMNTRIQVEHPVTEMITSRDIVADQIFIARSGKLPITQENVNCFGHSIQTRIYAEDPENDFLPCSGQIIHYKEPDGNYIRVDSAFSGPGNVSGQFDPMLAKLIAFGNNRNEALSYLEEALRNFRLYGVRNNIDYLISIISHKPFRDNIADTSYCSRYQDELTGQINENRRQIPWPLPLAAYAIAVMNQKPKQIFRSPLPYMVGFWRQQPAFNVIVWNHKYNFLSSFSSEILNIYIEEDVYTFENIKVTRNQIKLRYNDQDHEMDYVLDTSFHLYCHYSGVFFQVISGLYSLKRNYKRQASSDGTNGSETLSSPMHGRVISIVAEELQEVKKGDILMVIEAMKMENNVIAPRDGIIKKVNVPIGAQVNKDTPLIVLQ
jgi:3-methylcrotonyl-CoA carboxylase alpha subunit